MEIQAIGIVRRLEGDWTLLAIDERYREGWDDITVGRKLDVLYWMHELDEEKRHLLKVHRRGDRSRPTEGVFGLRSPLRPNPIGVTEVEVVRVGHDGLVVSGLDALEGSPILDIKSSRRRQP